MICMATYSLEIQDLNLVKHLIKKELWCGAVSKTLAPGYRVGWIAPGRFKEAIIRRKIYI